MINLFSGTPGSGKSYHMARFIYSNIKYQNCVIIANFDINLSSIKHPRGQFYYVTNDKITPQFLADFAKNYISEQRGKGKNVKEGQIILIIDEAQLLFNAREWSKAGRNDWNAFFTQHRHLKYDIYFVAQFDRMLDRYIRCLIEYEYIHRKVNNYGKFGKFLSILCGGNFFAIVKRWYPMKENVDHEFCRGCKKYYKIYDTEIIFNAD